MVAALSNYPFHSTYHLRSGRALSRDQLTATAHLHTATPSNCAIHSTFPSPSHSTICTSSPGPFSVLYLEHWHFGFKAKMCTSPCSWTAVASLVLSMSSTLSVSHSRLFFHELTACTFLWNQVQCQSKHVSLPYSGCTSSSTGSSLQAANQSTIATWYILSASFTDLHLLTCIQCHCKDC